MPLTTLDSAELVDAPSAPCPPSRSRRTSPRSGKSACRSLRDLRDARARESDTPKVCRAVLPVSHDGQPVFNMVDVGRGAKK